MSTSIGKALSSIEDAASAILSQTDGAIQWQDLEDCITGLVAKGGLNDGESCVTKVRQSEHSRTK